MELAYAAGLFDGEGCILVDEFYVAVAPGRPKAYNRQQLKVSLGMNHFPTIRALYDQFGGMISRDDSANRRNPNHALRYTWSQWSSGAGNFLIAIVPFLITKREQARIAIRFQNNVRLNRAIFLIHRGAPPNWEKTLAYRARLIEKLRHHKAGRFDVPKDKLKTLNQKWPYVSVL
jgi:hypothetical protein